MTVVPTPLFDPQIGVGQNTQSIPMTTEGRVLKIYLADDPKNSNKVWPEYDVAVDVRGPNGFVDSRIVRCRWDSQFGTPGDYAVHLPANFQPNIAEPGDEAVVLVSIPNNNPQRGTIVGSRGHPKTIAPKKIGHKEHFVTMNGVTFWVKADGSLQVEMTGKTSQDGTPSPADASAKVTIDLAANGDMVLKNAKASVAIEHASGRVNIQSAGVTMGAGTSAQLLATPYRAAETVANTAVATAHTTESAAFAGMAGFFSTLALAPGLAAIAAQLCPDPAAATAFIAAVVAAAAAVAPAVGTSAAAGTAIGTFEAGAASYLSPKNTLD